MCCRQQGGRQKWANNFSQGEMDQKFCIRHKEHDFVWIASQHKYKKPLRTSTFIYMETVFEQGIPTLAPVQF